MNKLSFSIIDGDLNISDAPAFSPVRPFLKKAMDLLRRKMPGFLKHIEKARGIGRIDKLLPVINGTAPGRPALVNLITRWKTRESTRLLIMFIGEVLILPFSILFAVVPGPNILGYLVVILLWFHFPAVLSIFKIKPEELADRFLESN